MKVVYTCKTSKKYKIKNFGPSLNLCHGRMLAASWAWFPVCLPLVVSIQTQFSQEFLKSLAANIQVCPQPKPFYLPSTHLDSLTSDPLSHPQLAPLTCCPDLCDPAVPLSGTGAYATAKGLPQRAEDLKQGSTCQVWQLQRLSMMDCS